MSIVATLIDVLAGAQTEVAIFLIAIIAHVVLFGSYSIKPAPTKGKRLRQAKLETGSRPQEDSPHLPVVRAIKQLCQQGAVQDQLTEGLQRHLAGLAAEDAIDCLQAILDNIGKATPADLAVAVRAHMREQKLQLTGRLGELLMRTSLACRLDELFQEVLAEVEQLDDATPGAALLALRAALAVPDFEKALERVRIFASQWKSSIERTPSAAPQAVMQQLVRIAAEKTATPKLLQELHGCGLLSRWMLECVTSECAQRGESTALSNVQEFAVAQKLTLTPACHCAFVRLMNGDKEILGLYDAHLKDVDVSADSFATQMIVGAAWNAKRLDIINGIAAACKDSNKLAALMRAFTGAGALDKATALFQASPQKNTSVYNTLLSICIDAGDSKAAKRVMTEAVEAKAADVVTHNTMIKAHLLAGDIRKAYAAIETMQAAGLSPNCVTFNELIDATIKTDVQGAWKLVEKMEACGLKPSHVTCSILLKSVQKNTRPADIDRTMALLDATDDMDEVLLGSACEACIRAGRGDLIQHQLKRQRSKRQIRVKSAHTFGSLIRAYGFVQDQAGAWEVWQEMRMQNIVPTSITIGCMVESCVANGNPQAGYELIRELLTDEKTRPLVNAVIYCSVLKGFSHQKSFARVWAIYDEMTAEKIQLSIITYNALIDACARSCEMVRVPALLEEMNRNTIEPNIVTYSTIIKGYCNDGKLDKAFELLADMKKKSRFHPDEITYNTLLDGCARQGLYKRGVSVLEEMQEVGVPPSNFTLSLLAKLASRSNVPDKAFELCEDMAKTYSIRWNVHVYNNLVQACAKSADSKRALNLFDQMIGDKVYPDARTYTLLLRLCVQARQSKAAAGLLCAATGARSAHSDDKWQCPTAKLRGGLASDVISETIESIAGVCGNKDLAVSLVADLRNVRGLKMDSRLVMKLASQ